MKSSKREAERLSEAMKALGASSAHAGETNALGHVVFATVSDMASLLFENNGGVDRVVDWNKKLGAAIEKETRELKTKIDLLNSMAKHNPEDCENGKHVTKSWATGGRRGHCATQCYLCNYSVDGYD